MNKADYAKKMQDLKGKSSTGQKATEVSNDFKIALAAVCSEEDYAAIDKQFFQGN